MITLEVDGKTVEVESGSTVMDAANKLGVHVPHFVTTRNYLLLRIVGCVWLRLKKRRSLCLRVLRRRLKT